LTDGIYTYTFTQTDGIGNVTTVTGTWNKFSVVFSAVAQDAAINQGSALVTVNLTEPAMQTVTVPITIGVQVFF
jgi:hypothetical protein